ncbi:hypothetical protein HMPREF6745_1608 [Prevotella sp. oral taxon 472 str. F0295]|nr:hypothetical protein HMPREF6745_1608 [Prevotella sp. oral taxon 472 str. F0295]
MSLFVILSYIHAILSLIFHWYGSCVLISERQGESRGKTIKQQTETTL